MRKPLKLRNKIETIAAMILAIKLDQNQQKKKKKKKKERKKKKGGGHKRKKEA